MEYKESKDILLTEELLVRYGGEIKSGWVGLSFNMEIGYETVEFTFELMDGTLTLYCGDTRIKIIDSPTVHQLKNLYFVLKEKEIKKKM